MSFSKNGGLILLFSFLFFTLESCHSQKNLLSKGDKAPLFSAEASLAGDEFSFSLRDAVKKGPVVLYFYPSAYTKGCDIEAHTFAEMKPDFEKEGTTIIGVSADDINRLNDFSADPDYCAGAFPVASDPKGEVAKKYGLNVSWKVPGMKDVRGQKIDHGFIQRVTYVIDKDGKIAAVFSSEKDGISPEDHVHKSLEMVKSL